MTKIKTRHIRKRHSKLFGEVLMEYTYIDQPSTIETWYDGAKLIAQEEGIDATDAHLMLMAVFPERYGLPK